MTDNKKDDGSSANANKYSSVKEAWDKGEDLNSFLDKVMVTQQKVIDENKKSERIKQLEKQLNDFMQDYKREAHESKKKLQDLQNNQSNLQSNSSSNNYKSTNNQIKASVPKHPAEYPILPQGISSTTSTNQPYYTSSHSSTIFGNNRQKNNNKKAASSSSSSSSNNNSLNVNVAVNADPKTLQQYADMYNQAKETKKMAEAYRKIEEKLQEKNYNLLKEFYDQIQPGDLLCLKRPFAGLKLTLPVDHLGKVPQLGYNLHVGKKHSDPNWTLAKVTLAPEIKAGETLMFLGFVEYKKPEEVVLPCEVMRVANGSFGNSFGREKITTLRVELHGAKWLYNGKTFISHKFPEIKNLKAITGTLPPRRASNCLTPRRANGSTPGKTRSSVSSSFVSSSVNDMADSPVDSLVKSLAGNLPQGTLSPNWTTFLDNDDNKEAQEAKKRKLWCGPWWRNEKSKKSDSEKTYSAEQARFMEVQAQRLGYSSFNSIKNALQDTNEQISKEKEKLSKEEMEIFAKHNKLVELDNDGDFSIGCVKKANSDGEVVGYITKVFKTNKIKENE